MFGFFEVAIDLGKDVSGVVGRVRRSLLWVGF